jgi:hypothetical protein
MFSMIFSRSIAIVSSSKHFALIILLYHELPYSATPPIIDTDGAAFICVGLAWLIASNFNRKVEEVAEVGRRSVKERRVFMQALCKREREVKPLSCEQGAFKTYSTSST